LHIQCDGGRFRELIAEVLSWTNVECIPSLELIACIAHEINQPLAAIVTNADAGLRWLSGDGSLD
jgi:hypothetical protein